MTLSKNFEHRQAEEKWYSHWLQKGYFHSEPDDREPYTVVIPPPNVTGVLHMGHCLNNTIQDILVRRARMSGRNACWVPGTDHASIATEAKVVQMLREKGIQKGTLTREEFLRYAWEWKEQYGGIILQQLKKLGCSLDWERTTFTMDPDYYRSVISVFVDLYEKGYIYRGKRMIHWDPRARTALSDEEVIYKEVQGKLYFVRYRIEGDENATVTIATVRPETILGDTAICVHPADERYKHLHGRFAFVPLINRRIPIIADEYVSMEFGSGALKVTPAHDMNDYQLAQKHGLPIVEILNDDGTLSADARLYIAEDRFQARKKVVEDLRAADQLEKIEDYVHQVGYSERTDVVVEPRLSMQWWVRMKELAEPALQAMLNDEIRFYPPKFRNLYRHWMENIRDWCISRQLWWGHRIPAWYDEAGNVYVARSLEELHEQRPETRSLTLMQDEDCLDTWFSSWLWPFEVFKGYSDPGNRNIRYYYPTHTLVTAPEIIFFWVARMIMAGFEYTKKKPFREVYFTGIVRDEIGRKMSKQLGNSPDLLELIDRYGADAVRFGIMIASPAGNDLLFDVKEESTLKQGSFFSNKIWNALRLVKSWESRIAEGAPANSFPAEWFENRLSEVRTELDSQFGEFRLSEALKTIYSLIWDDFCSWYLEWIKPAPQQGVSREQYAQTLAFFEILMQLLHPFMPFVTEEVYHHLRDRADDITVSCPPSPPRKNEEILRSGDLLKQIITAIRDARNRHQLRPRDSIRLHVQTSDRERYSGFVEVLSRQVNATEIIFTSSVVPGSIAVVVDREKFFIEAAREIDPSAQKEELQKDLNYLRGFLASVEKKLGNERFVQNAKPEVIASERKKKADAEARIRAIEESLANLR
ncbi:MAG TPA: valine--tRNA ligase [Chitinophagaceae bacterium]|nr:valine--tRNA ligase [Chitinophagaceae bacterium]